MDTTKRFWPLLAGLLALHGGTTAFAAEVIEISHAACRYLEKHVPADDVAYKPGVDVHGKPVVPADLDGGRGIEMPETFTIDILVLLQQRFGIPSDSVLYRPEARVGVVEVKGDALSFNGQPLGSAEQRALAAACREEGLAAD